MKTNKLWLGILIGVLITIIICLMAFIVYDKVLTNNDNNQPNNMENNNGSDVQNEETIVDLSLNNSIVKELSDKVIGVYTNNFMSKYNDYFYKKDKISLVSEDISFKLSLAAETVSDSFSTNNQGYDCNNGICGVSYIDETTLKNAYYELFGNDSNYSRVSFSLAGCVSDYTWSDTNNRYEATIPAGCGGATIGGSMSKLGYAKQITSSTMDKIELYEYFALEVVDTDIKYYSDYNQTNLITSATDKYSVDDFFTKFTEQVGLYKYTFEKDINGTYVFTSVEKVK